MKIIIEIDLGRFGYDKEIRDLVVRHYMRPFDIDDGPVKIVGVGPKSVRVES